MSLAAPKNLEIYDPQEYAKSGKTRSGCIQQIMKAHGGLMSWEGVKNVLEIGCGIGDVTEPCFLPLLPRDFERYVCSDGSIRVLDAAKTRFRGLEHIEFLQLDIENPIDKNLVSKFDRILSTFCLMYVKNQRQSYENIFNALIPGGDCWIVVLTTAVAFETLFRLAETSKWKNKLRNIHDVLVFAYRNVPEPEKMLENLLKSIGFIDISVKLIDFQPTYKTDEDFRANVESFPNFFELSVKDLSELLDDQVDVGKDLNVIKDFHVPGKPVFQPLFQSLVIYAKKP
ncbi:Methyltransferase domain 25 [Sergentomyia squamirostris]